MSLVACSPPRDDQDAAARSGVYALLARLWRKEIDAELLASLQSDSIRGGFEQAGADFDAQTSLDDLALDYCRLFLGPANHLPPYQSVWTSGQFEGEVAGRMRQYLEMLGLMTLIDDGTMPDHVGVQLHVMAALLEQWRRDEQRDVIEEIIPRFFDEHIRWLGEVSLIERAQSLAETPLYQSVMRLTREFLAAEGQAEDGQASG